jgi:site-specific DNA recombinase
VVNGMERRAARGCWTGTRPFGYDVNESTGFLIPNPADAPLVPLIFERYVHQRVGVRSVAVWLNDDGHRTKYGKPWNHMAVLTVLRNPVYTGTVVFRGTYHEAPHPPVVDRAGFDAAQELLTARGEDYGKRAGRLRLPTLWAGGLRALWQAVHRQHCQGQPPYVPLLLLLLPQPLRQSHLHG